ncbi:hypothetical protein KKD61_02765 [Patescibacteria group bacterium]|nr:hypothetical protein [Patescibacteria group bacterium]
MLTNSKIIEEVIGWYGTIAIVGAYALLNFNVISAGGMAYQLLNATGALGIVVSSFRKKAYQPGILNIIWTIIAITAIIKMII